MKFYSRFSNFILDFENILIYLESYFVRRLFTGVSTRSLGKVFESLYSQAKECNPENFVDGVYQTLTKFEGNKIWPTDEDFKHGILTKSIYHKSSSDRAKLILELIERKICSSKESIDLKNITVEHILPQTLNKQWKKILGPDLEDFKQSWIHTLGNLTLTGYNSELSNKPWSQKRRYLNTSNLTLNQYFKNIDSWNLNEIKRRAEYLANIAVRVWPR